MTRINSRQSAVDASDFFPTPQWATRSFVEWFFAAPFPRPLKLWEPACGQGHMAHPLLEYFDQVVASDLLDYGYGRAQVMNFLTADCGDVDIIFTNPPFNRAEEFALKALSQHPDAMVVFFVKANWLFSQGRYDRLFSNPDWQPTHLVFNTVRVPCLQGRVDPDGSTNADYLWIVWARGKAVAAIRPEFQDQSLIWIPPERTRRRLTVNDKRHNTLMAKIELPEAVWIPDQLPPQNGMDTTPLFGGSQE